LPAGQSCRVGSQVGNYRNGKCRRFPFPPPFPPSPTSVQLRGPAGHERRRPLRESGVAPSAAETEGRGWACFLSGGLDSTDLGRNLEPGPNRWGPSSSFLDHVVLGRYPPVRRIASTSVASPMRFPAPEFTPFDRNTGDVNPRGKPLFQPWLAREVTPPGFRTARFRSKCPPPPPALGVRERGIKSASAERVATRVVPLLTIISKERACAPVGFAFSPERANGRGASALLHPVFLALPFFRTRMRRTLKSRCTPSRSSRRGLTTTRSFFKHANAPFREMRGLRWRLAPPPPAQPDDDGPSAGQRKSEKAAIANEPGVRGHVRPGQEGPVEFEVHTLASDYLASARRATIPAFQSRSGPHPDEGRHHNKHRPIDLPTRPLSYLPGLRESLADRHGPSATRANPAPWLAEREGERGLPL